MDGLDASVVWWLFAISLVLLLATPVVVGWIVVRLPVDYFTAKRREPAAFFSDHPVWRPVVLVVKNLLGVLLVVAGVLMLFVPGQGILTIVMGVLLLDFPGKFRLERWLVTRRAVWRPINWLRRRAGREAFQKPKANAAS
jgi:hypothetical protein